MKKCVFFLPYFGTFPAYFEMFLRSCATNTMYNWIVFTDNKEKYCYPSNVKAVYLTFQEFRRLLEKRLGKDIVLLTPYKLCDFKPTYGYVFSEYIKDYEYWGHCDCDIIFGDLNRILTPLLEKGYDKLFAAGHLTIYKNTELNNRRFMADYHGRLLYKEFLTVPEICWFDEDWKKDNIHTMFLAQNAKVYSRVLACNPSGKYPFFIQRNYISCEHRYEDEKYRKALYIWSNGTFFRQYEKNGKLVKEEFMYLHLQHRKMKMDKDVLGSKTVQIVPNRILSLPDIPETLDEWKKIKKEPLGAYLYVLDNLRKRMVRKLKNGLRINRMDSM